MSEISGPSHEQGIQIVSICPTCAGLKEPGSEHSHIAPGDIIFNDKSTAAFVAPLSYREGGTHVIVAPVEHYASILDVPRIVNAKVAETAQRVAKMILDACGMKRVTIIYDSKPVDDLPEHYQWAVYPRSANDRYEPSADREPTYPVDQAVRAGFAAKLRAAEEAAKVPPPNILERRLKNPAEHN